MPIRLGAHAGRLTRARALRTRKGRREQGRFAFEGPTLLAEAQRSGTRIDELYVTAGAYAATPLVRALEAGGTPTYEISDASVAKLSDVETPTGIVAVASTRLAPGVLPPDGDGVVLVLGDVGDPANAGALLRSAEAFGALAVVFGALGVDPYHPKVVRGAMGALFRLPLGLAEPTQLAARAAETGFTIVGLRPDGDPLRGFSWPARCALVVGHERRGLDRWTAVCGDFAGIPMEPGAESLNAAIAGSIALYEASANSLGRARR
jgi:RNA methyltransferase, TrmH family